MWAYYYNLIHMVMNHGKIYFDEQMSGEQLKLKWY